jgi:AcrR family transcriptional regulator
LPAAERRQSLIDEGWRLLIAEGPRAVQIDAVVENLGVSRPIFYRHFPDRIAFLVALYEVYADELVTTWSGLADSFDGTLSEFVQESMHRYFDLVTAHGVMVRPLIEAAQGDPRMEEARAELRRSQTIVWGDRLRRLAPPEVVDAIERNPRGLELVTSSLELIQAACVEAAGMYVRKACSRAAAEEAVLVLIDGLPERIVAALAQPRPPARRRRSTSTKKAAPRRG